MASYKHTPYDMTERLRAMAADDGETWDLSDNDKEAITYALECIERPMADDDERPPLPESARLAVEAVEEWAKGLCDSDLAAMAASPRPYGVSERTHKIAGAELARRGGR